MAREKWVLFNEYKFQLCKFLRLAAANSVNILTLLNLEVVEVVCRTFTWEGTAGSWREEWGGEGKESHHGCVTEGLYSGQLGLRSIDLLSCL